MRRSFEGGAQTSKYGIFLDLVSGKLGISGKQNYFPREQTFSAYVIIVFT